MPGKPGKRRELPPMPDVDGMDGPKMDALSALQRRFVEALYLVPLGHGYATSAAMLAGLGHKTSSKRTLCVLASRMMRDPMVIEAIHEVDQKVYRGLAPRAIRSLGRMIENPAHKDHCRAAITVVNKFYPAETTHTINVQHTPSQSMAATEKVLQRIMELAERAQVAPMIEKMIDVTPVPEKSAP